MGTWGTGMQANDIAAEGISEAEDSSNPVEYLKKNIKKWLKPDKFGEGYQLILGVADYCLDQGLKFDKNMKNLIKQAVLSAEKDENSININKPGRREALDRFVHRLNGQKVNKRLIAKDNEGLFCKQNNT